jgi:hypothetical protein
MFKPLAGLLLASALVLAACSSDSDSSPSPTDDAPMATVQSTPATGGDVDASAVILEDPNSSASAAVSQVCLTEGTGQVTIELSGYEAAAGTVIDAEVGTQTAQIQVNADGTGIQIRQGSMAGEMDVTVPLPEGGELETELPGC